MSSISNNNSNDNAEEELEKLISALSFSSSHIIIHFDINETILVGDEAGGDTRADCLNKMLAKSAFVQIPSDSNDNDDDDDDDDDGKKYTIKHTEQIIPTHWYNGTPIDSTTSEAPPPPPLYTKWKWPKNTCPYYRTSYKKRAKQFTSLDGKSYLPLYKSLDQILSIADAQSSSTTKIDEHHPFHHMIPSFFHTLYTLRTKTKRKYTVVLRTFGSELRDVCKAISDFGRGNHPLYPGFYDESLITDDDENLFRGRWVVETETTDENNTNKEKKERNKYQYNLYKYNDKKQVVADKDVDILKLMESKKICGIQDDYPFWSSQNCIPWAGKPVWVVPPQASSSKDQNHGDGGVYRHHLFFDDNIHNDPTDSIVSVRYYSNDGKNANEMKFKSLSGKDIIKMHGLHIVRVPTIEPVMDVNWFLRQIVLAEEKVASLTGHVGYNIFE